MLDSLKSPFVAMFVALSLGAVVLGLTHTKATAPNKPAVMRTPATATRVGLRALAVPKVAGMVPAYVDFEAPMGYAVGRDDPGNVDALVFRLPPALVALIPGGLEVILRTATNRDPFAFTCNAAGRTTEVCETYDKIAVRQLLGVVTVSVLPQPSPGPADGL